MIKELKKFLLILLLGLFQILNSQSKKPNILVLFSDDLNTALSGYGHVDCKTPNLDRLAAHGVQFDRMYAQFPLCGPSRASILTGLYPYTTNVLVNPVQMRSKSPNVVTMPQTFRANNYYVARVSKIFHMSIPAEIRTGTAKYDDPQSWDTAINIQCKVNSGPTENWSPKKKGSQGFVATYGIKGDSDYADGMAADQAIELINKMDSSKPFFLGVGFVRPHVPLIAPQKYYDLYNRNDLTIPFAPENDLDDLPEIIQNDQTGVSMGITTPETHKGLLEAYYASISYMDAQVGKVLDALDANGLRENTIVVFLSDHGYLLGDHHKFQKRHLFEEGIRVPFIVSVPWLRENHGKKSTKITELIDLYPTLLDLAGVSAIEELQGNSLVPLLKNINSPDWTKEQAFTVSVNGGESIRTESWKYIQWGFGKLGNELYDLKKDPGEFTNQAKNPVYATVLKKLKNQLGIKRVQAGYKGKVTQEPANSK